MLNNASEKTPYMLVLAKQGVLAMARDLLLNETDNNFAFSPQRDIQLSPPNSPQYWQQKIRHAISIFLGEYFFNPLAGVPYIPNSAWNKQEHINLVINTVQVIIKNVEGVAVLERFTTSLVSRQLTIDFVVKLTTGATISDSINIGEVI